MNTVSLIRKGEGLVSISAFDWIESDGEINSISSQFLTDFVDGHDARMRAVERMCVVGGNSSVCEFIFSTTSNYHKIVFAVTVCMAID